MAYMKSEQDASTRKEGGYNEVSIQASKGVVQKFPKYKSELTDAPKRCIRVWNDVNPTLPAACEITETVCGFGGVSVRKGWECLYIKGPQASDLAIAEEVLAIFNRTGRIVVDAMGKENFLRRESDNKVVCVDVAMALDLESRPGKRRGSKVSFDAWKEYRGQYVDYYKWYGTKELSQQHNLYSPITIALVKTLLLIKYSEFDIDNVLFLKNNTLLTSQIANHFELLINSFATEQYIAMRKTEIRSVLKKCFDEAYQRELNHYVTSGGEDVEVFKSSLSLRFFGRSGGTGSLGESSLRAETRGPR